MAEGNQESYLTKAAIAGCSCAFAGFMLNPVDVVKVRMQNSTSERPWAENNMIRGMRRIIKTEGLQGLGLGARATILRELTYSTIRMGAYEPIMVVVEKTRKMIFAAEDEMCPPPAAVKYISALISGAVGASIANPTDLIKVNLQAALHGHKLPYTTTFGGFKHIYCHEGIRGLYKGTFVTSVRAALVTSAAIGTYDVIKNNIVKPLFGVQDGLLLFSICFMLAGIVTATAANPADVIKTRYMIDVSGRFKGPLECFIKTVKEGGFGVLMKGWTPAYFRIGPYTIISFVMMEQARMLLGIGTL